LGDVGVDGRTILKLSLKEKVVRLWTGFSWLRISSICEFCEYGNEPSGSTKDREFLRQLSGYQILKKDSAPWVPIMKLLIM
jgi:hypothetical protein